MKQRTPQQRDSSPEQKRTGLARAISKLGFCSRSQAVARIKLAQVRVNGILRTDPESPVLINKDKITIDGRDVSSAAPLYFMINKPKGLVTTTADEKGRETVYSCLPKDLPWLAPVGRLDQASEGLLLFTNDSAWAARIAAPESHLDKTYHVQISKIADESFMGSLRNGITTGDGDVLQVRNVRLLRAGTRNSWLEIILDEGKNRHIRRMLEHCKVEVLRLIRVSVGPLNLEDLPKSSCRELTAKEKLALDRAMSGDYPFKPLGSS